MPLWRGPPHVLSVSTSLGRFDYSGHRRVRFGRSSPHDMLTGGQVSGWQSLKGYAAYKGRTLDPQFIQRLVKKEGGVSLVMNARPYLH